MDTCRKRKVMTLHEKIKIIRDIEGGQTQAEIGRKLNLSKTTVNTIWKNKDSIIAAFEQFSSKTKKLRTTPHEDIDKALLKWFTIQRNMNIPITGAVLQAKAEDFAKLFNKDFICSVGWLERFKKRHNIICGKISGEAAEVSTTVIEQWINVVWPEKKEEYAEEDIFNCDETGIFYKLTPEKTLKFKGEKCVGGKKSKERLTVLLCANMTGNEKRKLLVIGKAKQPRCFKNVKKLPVRYVANRKAWMTSEIFREELRLWDKELQRKKRKILLILDNCPAHPLVDNLSSIELMFLPSNTTAKIQPMDQGVIRSLKSHFRKFFMQHYILALENKEKFTVSILDAIRMLNKSWQCVTSATIKNCFRHAHLSAGTPSDDEENIPLSEWLKMQNIENVVPQQDIDLYASVDDDLVTSETPSDSEIVASVSGTVNEDSESDNNEDEYEEQVPKVSEALSAIKTLSRFVEFHTDYSETLQSSIMNIENVIFTVSCNQRKQQKITDYFSK